MVIIVSGFSLRTSLFCLLSVWTSFLIEVEGGGANFELLLVWISLFFTTDGGGANFELLIVWTSLFFTGGGFALAGTPMATALVLFSSLALLNITVNPAALEGPLDSHSPNFGNGRPLPLPAYISPGYIFINGKMHA